MSIPVGSVITANVAGSAIDEVTCEKCGTHFYYELTRVGTGKGSAVLFLGQRAAADRAAQAAQQDLYARLRTQADLVPCPKCNWVNRYMVDRYRDEMYKGAPLLIVVIVVVGFMATLIVPPLLHDALGESSPLHKLAASGIAGVTFLAPFIVLLVRHRLRLRVDPNATYPRRPVLPPGSPPALVEQLDRQTGERILGPVPTRADEPATQVEWATFRPTQFELPDLCCVCLSPATTTYRPPLQVDAVSDLPVPMCDGCRARRRQVWWSTLAIVVLASVLVGSAAFAVPGTDRFGRWLIMGLITVLGSLMGGVVIAGRVARPYRMKTIDANRGIVQFAAMNREYTAMLVDQVRRSDGIMARQ